MRSVFCFGAIRWDLYASVSQLPLPNFGCDVRNVREGLGGDAALVAACCTQLGVSAHLVGNAIGDDERGRAIVSECQRFGICLGTSSSAIATPWNATIQDQVGNRTWFGFSSEDVAAGAATVPLDSMSDAAVVYVDGYFGAAARRAARAASALRVPLVVNLADDDVRALASIAIIPEHVAQPDVGAYALAEQSRSLSPMTIITCGAAGCFVLMAGKSWHKDAHSVVASSPSGAGAAFAAGICAGLAQGAFGMTLVDLASACGALYCYAGLTGFTRDALLQIRSTPAPWSELDPEELHHDNPDRS